MTIKDAVKAMRAHRVHIYADFCLVDGVRYDALDAAQAACDRLNLLAVLEAIMEPTTAMIKAGWIDKEDVNPDDIWGAMIDALIAEMNDD
jgi:hypothetical protein